MFSFKETLRFTREKLTELSKEQHIIFIVDELDRCLPSYAIKVLERLHHLFDKIDNIIVIISIDKKQLEHSIKQIYGNDVNVDKYLKKFINFSLALDNGTLNTNFKNKYSSYFSKFSLIDKSDQDFFSALFSAIFNEVDIRTQEKLLYKSKIIHEIISSEEQLNPALLCFEIMFITFSYLKGSYNLHWILEINKTTYSGLSEAIGKSAEDFLKKSEKSIGTETVRAIPKKQYRVIKDKLLDNTFWIFASLYYQIYNNNTCFEYYYENANLLSKEIDLAKKFSEIVKILK